MHTRCASERAQLLEQLSNPVSPTELIDLLRQVGVTREMVQKATGAKSAEVVGNWVVGRTAPRSQHFERLDCLRVAVSFLLQTNALEDDGRAIAMWLNSYPACSPFLDDRGVPAMTPLQAIREGKIREVVDAAQMWIEVRQEPEASENDSFGNWAPA